MEERRFIHQCTDATALDALLHEHEQNNRPLVAYIGFDCTAPSLHVGSLVQIMILRWFQKCGHKPIVLLGGGTTKIGDPSGKDQSRQLLDEAAIAENMRGIRQVFSIKEDGSGFLRFEEDCHSREGENPAIGHNSGGLNTDAMTVNNADWLDGLNYVEFLRDYGRYFSVNRMLTMESVKQRLDRESHLSFLEFNYMVLQAYDFVELNRRYGCRLQIGGSDQWGNIVMGTKLGDHVTDNDAMDTLIKINQFHQGKSLKELDDSGVSDVIENLENRVTTNQLYGLTTPLLTTASGVKMGKTADGAVWLNADMFSPYDYWQYWRNTGDGDVGRFLRLFTELPMEEINRLEALEGQAINEAKKILATEATALLHGRDAAGEALETARRAFEQGEAAESLPMASISSGELENGSLPAYKLFLLAGLAASGNKARELVRGGGARINDTPVTDENAAIALQEMADAGPVRLSAGKKKHKLVKVV